VVIHFESPFFSFSAIGLILVSTITLLMSSDWKWSIGALLAQYLGAFLLVGISWPVQMALVKLIAGWFSVIILAMVSYAIFGNKKEADVTPGRQVGSPSIPPTTSISGVLFHLLATVMIALVVISVIPEIMEQFPNIRLEQMLGAFIMISLGMLHLGLTAYPLRVIFGLLTVLAGFEIVYAAVELSTLVAGLLSGVNLGLAILGAYLVSIPTMGRSE